MREGAQLNGRVLSCFSGVGGLDLGLEAAGFATVACLETDPAARAALEANRPGWKLVDPADVVESGQKLQPGDLGLAPRELTLVAGGPPCQPFSKAAQWAAPKKGINDIRGTAVEGMLRLVASFQPKAVLMENVAGFLSGANNATEVIESSFAEINEREGTHYSLRSWAVDAADYGVPQHRRRAIVVAFRDEAAAELVLPTTHAGRHRTAWDAIGDAQPTEVPAPLGKYAELLASIPEGGNYQYLTARGAGPDSELFGYRTRFWSFLLKLAKDRPAWTLPASPGPSTGPFHWDNRPLTSEERLLLQGFPHSWKLASSERVNVRLAGNATPPPLAEAVGRFILGVLENGDTAPSARSITPLTATPSRKIPAPPAKRPRALPKKWHEMVGSRASHPGAGAGPNAHATTGT